MHHYVKSIRKKRTLSYLDLSGAVSVNQWRGLNHWALAFVLQPPTVRRNDGQDTASRFYQRNYEGWFD